ncbi:hypothetical protein EJ110_NYTH36345 [Nymphaea thermarum]|nr:hypothetical protein EJ110_NYTH36345 [Nymphaea thermarum]
MEPEQPSNMGDNSKIESHTEYKVVGNPFFYGSTVKLDGHNYEIWSRMFMMSVVGHRKDHIIDEDEPSVKTGKYATWKEDNSIVMSWIMNSVQADIAPTLAYYTTAKHVDFEFNLRTFKQHVTPEKVDLRPHYCSLLRCLIQCCCQFPTMNTIK